jgi:predicted SnoaL-like aldol condensation-catalyzing enzyme
MKTMVLTLTVTCGIAAMALAVNAAAQKDGMLEKNKALAHRYHMEVISGKNAALADELFAPDAVFHTPISKPGDTRGPVRAKEIAGMDYKGCPKGVTFVHKPTLAEGDFVSFYWTSMCTTETGEQRPGAGMDIVRIVNGKVAEIWIEWHEIKPDRTGT